MSDIILKIENISKQYRLGKVGTGTLSHDLNRAWHKMRGKEDPYLKIGAVNTRDAKATSDYVWALNDINFEVKRGEVLGIIGKNGAGKSTLLKILSRVTSPTMGTIKVGGRMASLLEVGTGMHPELTGRENIYLNGAIMGMTRAEIASKIDDIVAFSGCEMYIDTPVKRYSSGMGVRLGFAVAAFLEPDILVVDEVLAVGDAEFQKKAIGKMQDISNTSGRTVLFVSHNMAAVKNLCTRGIVLEHGRVVFEGGANDAVSYYLTTSNQKSDTSLANRLDRGGNGRLKVIGIDFLDEKNQKIDQAVSGSFLKIRLNLDKTIGTIDYAKLFVGVGFNDMDQVRIVSFLSDEMGSMFNALNPNSTFLEMVIPSLDLRGGSYVISFQVNVGTTSLIDLVDKIENAAEINVLPGDFWKSGKINRAGHYPLLKGYFVT